LFEKESAKEAGEDPDGEKEPGSARNPAGGIGREATARHDAVQMWMMHQGLAPRVEHGKETGVSSRAPDPTKLQQCLNVCNQGRTAIENFCRSLPDPRIRALCWAARWTVPACTGFCYYVWGD
jgi:hypothetical protein